MYVTACATGWTANMMDERKAAPIAALLSLSAPLINGVSKCPGDYKKDEKGLAALMAVFTM